MAPPGARASLLPRAAIEGIGCTACGTVNPFGMRFCTSCGRTLDARPSLSPRPPQAASPEVTSAATPAPPLADATKVCGRCAREITPSSLFCRFCGAPASQTAPAAFSVPRVPVIVMPPASEVELPGAPPTPRVDDRPFAQAEPPADAGIAPPPPAELPLNALGTLVMQAFELPPPPSAEATPAADEAQPVAIDERADEAAPLTARAALARELAETDPIATIDPSDAGPTGPSVESPGIDDSTPARRARFELVAIARDGTESGRYELADSFDVGRSEGDLCVGDDRYMAPRHARFSMSADALSVRDLGSPNGIYLRLRGSTEMHLSSPELILIGQQVLRFEAVESSDESFGAATQHGTLLFGTPAQPTFARLSQRTTEGVCRDVFHVRAQQTILGREVGDLVFTSDPFMSRRHAELTMRDNAFFIADLGSSNGTFVQIRGQVSLQAGDELRVGQQLYRVDGPSIHQGGSLE